MVFHGLYQVDESAYQPPQDLTEGLPKLEEDLKSAQADLDLSFAKPNISTDSSVGFRKASIQPADYWVPAVNVVRVGRDVFP